MAKAYPAEGAPELWRRVGFDGAQESEALRHLAAGRHAQAESLYRGLLDPVRDGSATIGPVGPLLIADVAQTANRILFPPTSAPRRHAANRATVIQRFADVQTAAEAADVFFTLLETWRREPTEDAVEHPLVRRAIDTIHRHYRDRLTLSDVARRLQASPSYLSRLFRRETGTTLTAYIQRVRLDHARDLLQRDDRTLAEIAYLVGYQNYRDFYRNFVKREKASPRQVRRRLASVRA